MDFKDPAMRTVLVENTLDLLANLRDSTGITAALAIMAENQHEGIVLASLSGKLDHCYVPRTGFRFHLHCTAPGKALLAYLPEHRREEILSEIPYESFTSHTFHDPESLAQELIQCSRNGYAKDEGEYVEGINCVASCIPWSGERPLAAIWITAFSRDLPVEDLDRFGRKVISIAQEMSVRLRNVAQDQTTQLDTILENTREFIDLHFLTPDAIEEYISRLSISDSWLRKSFSKRYGMSPAKYRQKLIFDRARRLLRKTRLSVKEIAFQLGFDNQNYFSRTFKTHVGLSPLEYRQKTL
jgi:DNA-binding IclR family transcriptional regulator/AraC-like DNA-binding protein